MIGTKLKIPYGKNFITVGMWLEDNMPNPPLPDAQRWSLYTENISGDSIIEFADEADAIMFSLTCL
jgi:hypothetical protein